MKDALGDRMKRYESVSKGTLLRRTPVIVRVDGKAFHTFTKKFTPHNDLSLIKDPFSKVFHSLMVHTAMGMMLCSQNAVLAYTQSDEISILFKDWSRLNSEQWFGGNIQKIASVSGAQAAAFFNYLLARKYPGWNDSNPAPTCIQTVPLFDARVFNLPKEEVTNYFIWRQKDASRNSVNMLARFYFSHKQLHGKNISEVQDMLMIEKGVNWNDLDTWKKRGTCVFGNPETYTATDPYLSDEEIPIFTQDRGYIEKYLEQEEE